MLQAFLNSKECIAITGWQLHTDLKVFQKPFIETFKSCTSIVVMKRKIKKNLWSAATISFFKVAALPLTLCQRGKLSEALFWFGVDF